MISPDTMEKVKLFHDNLSDVEQQLQEYFQQPYDLMTEKLSSFDKAKVDLMALYTANSLYWMYLCTKGENPQENGIKQEMERIKKYMDRLKAIQDKEKAPKLNQGTAKKFVRNALWSPEDNEPTGEVHKGTVECSSQAVTSVTAKKANLAETEMKSVKKRKMKK